MQPALMDSFTNASSVISKVFSEIGKAASVAGALDHMAKFFANTEMQVFALLFGLAWAGIFYVFVSADMDDLGEFDEVGEFDDVGESEDMVGDTSPLDFMTGMMSSVGDTLGSFLGNAKAKTAARRAAGKAAKAAGRAAGQAAKTGARQGWRFVQTKFAWDLFRFYVLGIAMYSMMAHYLQGGIPRASQLIGATTATSYRPSYSSYRPSYTPSTSYRPSYTPSTSYRPSSTPSTSYRPTGTATAPTRSYNPTKSSGTTTYKPYVPYNSAR
jgi:hypothetical protein